MSIQISTTKAHRGVDLKIIAYNTETHATTFAFIHKVHDSSYVYECTSLEQIFPIVHTGFLTECVEHTVEMLRARVSPPSSSEKIRAEVEYHVNRNTDLEWNPNTAH